jgi:hypothetical protein
MYIKSFYNTHILVNLKFLNHQDNLKKNLLKSLIRHVGNKCNHHGYLSSNNISIIEYTMGKILGNNISFNILYEGIITLPVIGTILTTKIISNEGLFYLADFDNIGKIFIITKNTLNVNETINIAIVNYYFNNGDKNMYLYGKYIENQNYLIPEIPTKEECDKYLNIYLKDNIEYNNISNISLATLNSPDMEFQTSFEESDNKLVGGDILKYAEETCSKSCLDGINTHSMIASVIGNTDTAENEDTSSDSSSSSSKSSSSSNSSSSSKSKDEKLYGGLNENITSEYIDNISQIELLSNKYKLTDNSGGLKNIRYNCYLNSVLFMLKSNDVFRDYIKNNNSDNINEIIKYYDTEQNEFDTALLIHNLNEMLDIDLYYQQQPHIFLDKFLNSLDNIEERGKLFYNFERINAGTLELNTNLKIDKKQQEQFNKEYKTIDEYVNKLVSSNPEFSHIHICKKYCVECNYEMTEVKLTNILKLDYTDEKSLQEIINNNKSKLLDIKCNLCDKYYYKEDNTYEFSNKEIILIIKNKLNKELNINRTLKINKMRGKIVSYILKTPFNSDEPHYRTLYKNSKLLYDDNKIYKVNSISEFIEDINMIHFQLE